MTDVSGINQTSALTGKIKTMQFGKDDAEQQLKELFGASYFNGGQQSIDEIEAQIKDLESKIKTYEQQLEDAKKTVQGIEDAIKTHSKSLKDIILNINDETRAFEKEQQDRIDEAITNAVNRTKSKNHPPQINTTFEREFMAELGNLPMGSTVLNALFGAQEALKDTIAGLSTKLTNAANDSKVAMNNLTNIQATITLLNTTKGNMTAQIENYYKNSNTDSKIPIYTYEKESFVAQLAADYNVDISQRGNQIANEGQYATRDEGQITALKDELKGISGGDANKGDHWTYAGNEQMQNLDKALFGSKAGPYGKGATEIQEDSIVYRMAQAGMSNTEIMEALAEAFPGVIEKNSNGGYTIIQGHTGTGDGPTHAQSRARQLYHTLTAICNNTAGLPEPPKPAEPDAKQLNNAMDAVDKMFKAGFSFKEAMYALDQLFPGLDIGYNLSEQAGTDNGIVRFTSNEKYTPLADKIRSCIGAEGSSWAKAQVVQAKVKENETVPTTPRDPISVKDGNRSIYFMADNGNGVYDGVSDMLGYENGMDDFEAKYGDYITTNAAGQKVITGDALDSIMVMVMEEIDNGDGSVSARPSFMGARDAGITEINLSSAQQNGSFNINGGEIQNTFSVTMNGKQMTAEQTMDDAEYLDATLNHSGLVGQNLFSQLTSTEINSAFDNALNNLIKNNASAAYLKEKIPELEQMLKDAQEGGVSEKDFQDVVKRLKDEVNDIIEIARVEGHSLYNDIQGDYGKDDNDDGNGATYRNSRGEALNEVIQERVHEKIKEQYPDYDPMSESEYQQFVREHHPEAADNQ